jgi:hypothetical protein
LGRSIHLLHHAVVEIPPSTQLNRSFLHHWHLRDLRRPQNLSSTVPSRRAWLRRRGWRLDSTAWHLPRPPSTSSHHHLHKRSCSRITSPQILRETHSPWNWQSLSPNWIAIRRLEGLAEHQLPPHPEQARRSNPSGSYLPRRRR